MNRLFIILVFFVAFTGYNCKHKPGDAAQLKERSLNEPADTAAGTAFPLESPGYINDFEQLFSPSQAAILDSMISEHEKQTTVEIVILTVDSMQTNPFDFDAYTLKVANHWNIGKQETKNGILIGISKQFRKIRINNGYGIEAKLSDAETKKIIDEIMIPEYKEGEYFEGTKKGLLALMQKLR